MKGSPLASIFQEETAAREGSSTTQVTQHCGGAGHLDQGSVPDTKQSSGLHLIPPASRQCDESGRCIHQDDHPQAHVSGSAAHGGGRGGPS